MFAHTYAEHVDRFVSVSASHPNLMWENLQSKSPINDYWLKFIQLPYLPEIEMTRNDSKFIEHTLPHLSKEPPKSSMYIPMVDSVVQQVPNKYDAYKYVFSRKSDWCGPLNYYRNLPFYKVAAGETVRCPCLIVIGKCLFTPIRSKQNFLFIKHMQLIGISVFFFLSLHSLTGSEDNCCRLDSVVRSTEYCDNYIVKIIENAGHWPHQEMPIEFNRAVLKFLVGEFVENVWLVSVVLKLRTENIFSLSYYSVFSGHRANQKVEPIDKTINQGIMGRMLGMLNVSNGYKIGTYVLDSVQQRTNNALH